MMKTNRKPSFERFLTAINRKEPDWLLAAEAWVPPKVKRAYMGKPVVSVKGEVEFWTAMGYNFVTSTMQVLVTTLRWSGVMSAWKSKNGASYWVSVIYKFQAKGERP